MTWEVWSVVFSEKNNKIKPKQYIPLDKIKNAWIYKKIVYPSKLQIRPSSKASSLILSPIIQVTTICLCLTHFLLLRDDLLSVCFYLNDIFLGLEKLSSPHKFIAFRWRLQEKKSTVPDSLTSGSFIVSKSPFSEKSVYSFWLSPGKNRTDTYKRVSAAKSLQSCPTLCDPIDGSPPGSSIPGILQARTLEWAAISFSNAWKWKVKVKVPSHAWLLETPWTAAYQAPLSMGFSRQEYWSRVPLPSPKRVSSRNNIE